MIDDAGPVSAGWLAAGATDDRRLITGVRGAKLFGVTVEPAGGSARPTTEPVTVPI
jgi:anti-sigma-K factor RskA